MKHVLLFVLAISILVSVKAQIQNGNFDFWEFHNGWERPVFWECASVSSETGSCDKITGPDGNLAVRVHNVMPCWQAESAADFRTEGYLRGKFLSPYDDFALSYRLRIDSIEYPAEFIIRFQKRTPPGGALQTYFEWSYGNLVDTTIQHLVFSTNENDSVFIELLARGNFNENASSSCKKGYISVIIDDVRLDEVVSTEFPAPDEISIYPNPARNELNILSGNELLKEIHLYSIVGEQVFSAQEINSIEYHLDLKGLHSGVYILSLAIGQYRIFRKIIKNE